MRTDFNFEENKGQQRRGLPLYDSGDVKAVATLESSVFWQKNCWHLMIVGIGMSKHSMWQILKRQEQQYYKVKCLDVNCL